jgi:hypothetical protein
VSTRLHLRCDGCFKEAEGGYLRKKFASVSGRSYGFGSWQMPNIDAAVPDGWVWSDPFTACTYCPECWKEIEMKPDADKGAVA